MFGLDAAASDAVRARNRRSVFMGWMFEVIRWV